MIYSKISQEFYKDKKFKEIDFDCYESDELVISLIDFKGPHCKKIEVRSKKDARLIRTITDLVDFRTLFYYNQLGIDDNNIPVDPKEKRYMKTVKVYAILNKAPLAREGQFRFHSEHYYFHVHHSNLGNVKMIEMIRKGDYKDGLSVESNSIFIKTLKDLEERVCGCS